MEKKQSTTQEQLSGLPPGIRASRPRVPTEYGVPQSTEGLLPWSHVRERMEKALHYWVSTVSPGGHPHAMPVDGLWLDDQLIVGGSPQTRWYRNLAANPAVCVHLESSSDVITLHGEAALRILDRTVALQLVEASTAKYGYAARPEDYEAGVFYLRPRLVFAWTQYPKDVTRWTIEQTSNV